MDKRKLMLLVGALVVALGTALAARNLFSGAAAPQVQAVAAPAPQGPKVMVAQRSLPVGTIITADSLAFQPWPKEMVQDAYFVEGEADMGKMLGTVVRLPIPAGQPLTQGALVSPGDRGFLAAALGPGMRAVTITVSKKTGVAGFVFPGDRVDVMLTQNVAGATGPGMKVVETFIRNLRVLATDSSAETETAENGKIVVKNFSTVTLEVTPKIAEKIAVADMIGTLNLSLRSIADNQADLEKAIAGGSVNVPEGADKAQEDKILSRIAGRPIDGATTYVTGGDVSRFQPRRVERVKETLTKACGSDTVADVDSAGVVKGCTPIVRVSRGPSGAEKIPVPTVRVSRGTATTNEPAGVK
jgi:pilus assembly protein CpaB